MNIYICKIINCNIVFNIEVEKGSEILSKSENEHSYSWERGWINIKHWVQAFIFPSGEVYKELPYNLHQASTWWIRQGSTLHALAIWGQSIDAIQCTCKFVNELLHVASKH